MKKSSIICITTGILLVIIGLSALFSLPILILNVIHSKLVLTENNPSFDLYKDLPLPIHQSFYFFHVLNPTQVQQNGEKPVLRQVGPFVYRMDMKKDLNLSQSDNSLDFIETMTYYFDRNQSFADKTFKITTLNAPLAIAMGLIERLPEPMRTFGYLFLEAMKEPFFVEKTVQELLFEGYPNLLTKLGPILNPKIPYQPNFGWMYNKNMSGDGLFRVNTGKSDLRQINSIELIDGLPQLTYWSGNHCNSFNGAKNGEFFNPIDSDQKSVLFFRSDFCRMWTMDFRSAFDSEFGKLLVNRFTPADNTFANFSDYTPNSCFTPNTNQSDLKHENIVNDIKQFLINERKTEILDEFNRNSQTFNLSLNMSEINSDTLLGTIRQFRSGIFDLSACHYGAPTFISFPHFLNADNYYQNTVTGLKPNATLHETYLDIEPITGTPIDVAIRLQLNVFVNPPTYSVRYRKMPKIVFPVFWQEFTIHMTQELAKQLRWSITGPTMIATIISSIFVALGVILLCILISRPLWKLIAHKTSSENSDSDSDALITDNINNENNDNQQQIN